MTIPVITLMDAYMLESLLSKGVKKEALVQAIENHSLDQFTQTEQSYDYAQLNESVKGKEQNYIDAVKGPYAISYLTINGLKNLLRIKYGFEEGTDFTLYEQKLEQLTVTQQQLTEIQALVGSVWSVKKSADQEQGFTTISILHASLLQ